MTVAYVPNLKIDYDQIFSMCENSTLEFWDCLIAKEGVGHWCPITRRNKSAAQYSHSVTALASPKDIEWSNVNIPVPTFEGANVLAVYMFQEKKLKLLKSTEKVEVSLEPFTFELLTVSPGTLFSKKLVQFAPIRLVNMLNTGRAIQSLEIDENQDVVRIGVKGNGEMKVFASEKPTSCKIDGVSVKFGYEDKMVTVQVPWPGSSTLSTVVYLFGN